MSDEPKTFCKAPFKTAVIDTGGELLPCCEFMTNESPIAPYKLNYADDWMFNEWWEKGLDPLREKMLKGEVDPGCKYCISKEKITGITSQRTGINEFIPDTFEEIKNEADNTGIFVFMFVFLFLIIFGTIGYKLSNR